MWLGSYIHTLCHGARSGVLNQKNIRTIRIPLPAVADVWAEKVEITRKSADTEGSNEVDPLGA